MRPQPVKTLEISLDGVISLSVRGEIVKAFLKYIVYERGLVPSHFDNLIRENLEIENTKVQRNRQKETFIDSMQKVLNCIEFSFTYPVEEVVILLGGNIVCPVDTYRLTFPPVSEACLGTSLPARKCTAEVIRSLVTWDEMQLSTISCSTGVHVFFLLPRESNLHDDFIEPNLSFQVPQSGHQFRIHCSSRLLDELNLSTNIPLNTTCNISGVEPLSDISLEVDVSKNDSDTEQNWESSALETVTIDNSTSTRRKLQFDSSCSKRQLKKSSKSKRYGVEEARTPEDNELIWFKVPIVMRGYKETFQTLFH